MLTHLHIVSPLFNCFMFIKLNHASPFLSSVNVGADALYKVFNVVLSVLRCLLVVCILLKDELLFGRFVLLLGKALSAVF